MNARQRKKLHLGEFQERIFQVRIKFHEALDDAAYDLFLDDFIDFIESRTLEVWGLGGTLPLTETEGMIQAESRGSPSKEDREAVETWLRARAEVSLAAAGELVDGWYGWD
jgi:hypothetical protein